LVWKSSLARVPFISREGHLARDAFFEEMLRVSRLAGGFPSRFVFELLADPLAATFARRRYPDWKVAISEFAAWLRARHPRSPLLLLLPGAQQGKQAAPSDDRRETRTQPFFGAPLKIREMRYAPTNEVGVILLFGILARELGFVIEGLRPGFPDCDAKRLTDPRRDLWAPVRIEFEFRSSGFRLHTPGATRCDLVVCWEHDWRECPVEVMELKELVVA
jgi:hypothetical protein